jgi:hypothetical protein
VRKRPEYQKRPVEITKNAWDRGYIEPFELARIAAWKSAKSVAGITVNNPEEIEDCTRATMTIIEPWRGRKVAALGIGAEWADWQLTANEAIGWVNNRTRTASGLLSLKGVEYPIATAILDILDPDVWPVLDKWAAMTVFGEVPSRYSAARYAAYAKHLATEGAKHWNDAPSIHELDERAQSASMKGGHLPAGWRICELPPFR